MSALLLAALAQAPADGEAEIVVYDELAVEMAREAVVEQLERTGYRIAVERDDHVVYRHPEAWRGEVRLYDDGWANVKRQPIQFRAPGDSPLAVASCALILPCLRAGGQTVGRRKLMHQKVTVMGAIDPELDALGDRVADREVGMRVGALPDALYALWIDGQPLSGEGHLATAAERKAAILAYWDSRTDTVWGDRVRLAVEAFLRAEVQRGEDPLTDEEIASFNAGRRAERALDLTSPWERVSAGLVPEWDAAVPRAPDHTEGARAPDDREGAHAPLQR